MESFNYIRALIWLLFLNGILFRGTKSKLYLRNSPIKIQFNETNNEDLLAKGKWSKARQLCADKNQRLLVITSSLKEEAKRYMNRTAFINGKCEIVSHDKIYDRFLDFAQILILQSPCSRARIRLELCNQLSL